MLWRDSETKSQATRYTPQGTKLHEGERGDPQAVLEEDGDQGFGVALAQQGLGRRARTALVIRHMSYVTSSARPGPTTRTRSSGDKFTCTGVQLTSLQVYK